MLAQHTIRFALICALSAGFSATARASDKHHCDDDDGDCRICEDDEGDCQGCNGDSDCDGDNGHGGKGACINLRGDAFGLCNAFCNAQQCQFEWKHSCDELRKNFQNKTGSDIFPCEVEPFPTPTSTATPVGEDEFCGELAGAAFGLCNAFCNAQACYLDPDHPSCDELRRNFARETGSDVFPCERALTPRIPIPGCMCDCDGDGRVSIDDLTRAVRMALGDGSSCSSLAHRLVAIQDLVVGVHNALQGCR